MLEAYGSLSLQGQTQEYIPAPESEKGLGKTLTYTALALGASAWAIGASAWAASYVMALQNG